ncbi:hypothetical protein EVAR_34004_1 [Eumeta japonica]|uniref:Uncharacterized protein n=1 Tax=Eumeta variegata TaxID=151549 RepID=A0A4C1VT82_EUMVA|nr:hypothetical protein EVAR_34004_1 [Eumeta japonica]
METPNRSRIYDRRPELRSAYEISLNPGKAVIKRNAHVWAVPAARTRRRHRPPHDALNSTRSGILFREKFPSLNEVFYIHSRVIEVCNFRRLYIEVAMRRRRRTMPGHPPKCGQPAPAPAAREDKFPHPSPGARGVGASAVRLVARYSLKLPFEGRRDDVCSVNMRQGGAAVTLCQLLCESN